MWLWPGLKGSYVILSKVHDLAMMASWLPLELVWTKHVPLRYFCIQIWCPYPEFFPIFSKPTWSCHGIIGDLQISPELNWRLIHCAKSVLIWSVSGQYFPPHSYWMCARQTFNTDTFHAVIVIMFLKYGDHNVCCMKENYRISSN